MEIRKAAYDWNGPSDIGGGELKVGDKAPDFAVTGVDWKPITSADAAGMPLVILTFPSVETPVCDRELRRFNEEAASLSGVAILGVSMDLPFSLRRWCAAAGVEDRIKIASDHASAKLAEDYGVLVIKVRLMARAAFVVGRDGNLVYVEYCKAGGDEPDYDKVLAAAKALL